MKILKKIINANELRHGGSIADQVPESSSTDSDNIQSPGEEVMRTKKKTVNQPPRLSKLFKSEVVEKQSKVMDIVKERMEADKVNKIYS